MASRLSSRNGELVRETCSLNLRKCPFFQKVNSIKLEPKPVKGLDFLTKKPFLETKEQFGEYRGRFPHPVIIGSLSRFWLVHGAVACFWNRWFHSPHTPGEVQPKRVLSHSRIAGIPVSGIPYRWNPMTSPPTRKGNSQKRSSFRIRFAWKFFRPVDENAVLPKRTTSSGRNRVIS